MSVLARFGLLFILVPLLELILLIRMGEWVGLWPTLALVVLTGAAGAALARAEGTRVLFQFQREVAAGRIPGQALLDGISVLVGGAFLLTPGILTDVVGFALLLPFTRRRIQRRLQAGLERRIREGGVHVVTMGPMGPMGPMGFGGGMGFPPGAREHPFPEGLDPRNEVRVPPREGESER